MPRIPFDLEARRPYLVPPFTDAEYDRRLAAVRREMARDGLDALCVYGNAGSPSAVTYLTNFTPAFGSAFVIVDGDGRVTVATDSVLHGEPMHSMIWMCRVADVRIALGPVYGGATDEVARLAADAVPAGARVGIVGTVDRAAPDVRRAGLAPPVACGPPTTYSRRCASRRATRRSP